MENKYSMANIAADLAMRIKWEQENGALGYNEFSERESDVTEPAGDTTAGAADGVADGVSHTSLSDSENPETALVALREEIGDCTRCELHRGRSNLVFGEGSPTARLVFVGEGPGRDEDLAGRPFVGAAGQLLDRIIVAMGLRRAEVYICNVVKCRPPNNRTPEDEERQICGQFVQRQLTILKPKVVVALGGTATQFLLGRDEPLGRLRGRFHEYSGLQIMPTYHPAYLLRNPSGKRAVWEDIQKVMEALGLQADAARRRG